MARISESQFELIFISNKTYLLIVKDKMDYTRGK